MTAVYHGPLGMSLARSSAWIQCGMVWQWRRRAVVISLLAVPGVVYNLYLYIPTVQPSLFLFLSSSNRSTGFPEKNTSTSVVSDFSSRRVSTTTSTSSTQLPNTTWSLSSSSSSISVSDTTAINGNPCVREAWATLFSTGVTADWDTAKSYLLATLVLRNSVQKFERCRPHRPFFVLHNQSFSEPDRWATMELSKMGFVDVPLSMEVPYPNPKRPELSIGWLKLAVWNLTTWDRIVVLDADMLAIGPLEGAFFPASHVPPLSLITSPMGAPNSFRSVNIGVMSIQPSARVFEPWRVSMSFNLFHVADNIFLCGIEWRGISIITLMMLSRGTGTQPTTWAMSRHNRSLRFSLVIRGNQRQPSRPVLLFFLFQVAGNNVAWTSFLRPSHQQAWQPGSGPG